MTTTTTPRVYVGTYGKYNDGSLAGDWLDLSDYSTKEEFYEACGQLHADEEDPEFMFQDHENDPNNYISESSIKDELWEYLEATADMDENEKEAFADYVGNGNDANVEDFRDAWQGSHKSELDFKCIKILLAVI